MAKKKKKRKSSIKTSLKYEVYGILLITVSVIALSGEATVGRSLTKLFGLILGNFYFVLALVGIYVGLVVMVKRAWPSGWSSRKTGILLFVLAFTLWSSITVMDQKTEPTGGLTAPYILAQLGSDVRGALLGAPSGDQGAVPSMSGGYTGAIEYTLLYWLFGYFGAKFIMIVMFAISIMLMTGKSYVELLRAARVRGGRLFSLLWMKISARRKPMAAISAKGASAAGGVVMSDDLDDDDDEDYEQLPKAVKPKRRSSFFSWFNDVPNASNADAHDTEWQMEDDHSSAALKGGNRSAQWHNDEDDQDENGWQAGVVEQFKEPEARMGAGAGAQSHLRSQSAAAEPEWEKIADTDEDAAVLGDYVPDDGQEPPFMDEEDNDDLEDGFDVEPTVSNIPTSPAITPDEADSLERPGSIVKPPSEKPYVLPSLTLLTKPSGSGKSGDSADSIESRRKLEATLESFGVRAKVLDVVRGPAVTRYEVQPATGVKVSRIVSLTDDIALALAAKDIRMEAPIPGKSAIGIEVPNTEVSVVTMREVMETPSFQNASSKLSIAFGRDISGQPIVGNLAKMPHLLVAGATGSGKSVCINGIITSILYKARPDEVKLLMIDPKMVELNMYNGIPHLLAPVVTDPRRASLALKKIVVEMEKRYELFSKSATRNIEGYNTLMADNPAAVLPYIVVIVDELADLMMVAANDVEDSICRLAQMARASGIHLIIATQRPSVDVITGVIKANIPSRIAFGVSSQVDSRTILDSVGAEKLLGRGDMLFLPVGMSKPIRVQGAFLSDQEAEAVVAYARGQAEAEYKEDLVPEIDDSVTENEEVLDELYDQAVRIVLEAKQASVSLLQRRMRIGYTRAARLIDQMEARSVVGPYEGSKPREVLLSLDQYDTGKISS
ncbi:S-DNA-T family DNA segregation ATPase FtsK/SpoIIIE [Paenibacillus taihuensis]|uniref:S-DNA-T family DNA segregation ATPase FtsK/SpoIIIE n=1 Tax=Paenibacillus taihuensis TaxID=1156355 RepID=A0A3D9SRY9_9BACL|nr:DNA translocase FtsK [Paenibacillus taihuensis]REE94481.1 S-DNA-T family DNA segregation ATPase FtsK/SpoIIIE [Paenibacillus taihuensis]